ncbi:methyltransferase domain-containing protein [Cellulomonas humilata]|uniref:Methyltransferase type 12 n=1 Tax=Cellulomonas humilata TaxID=144055 RepID=A0ABU0ED92_9CELL|nr:methyltransferase domain-containing protein [Cellulomonas humilata]MDQ0373073.1 hypothetical protein [Cellulomonas humilata]
MRNQDERRALLTELGRLGDGRGLEIGPLSRPIALRSACDVRYADIFSADVLRSRYLADPDVVGEDIPDIDFPLHDADGVQRSLRDVAARDAPYRWVLASHVIEHVPDLIGWLSDVAALLEDGGALVLAVPDRRYTFDARRPQTTVGQILDAHENGDVRPSLRAVYDHFRSVVSVPAAALWAGRVPTDDDRVHGPDVVADLLERRAHGEYVDAHVWMFTPDVFAEQVAELARLGVVDFVVTRILATSPDELEFYALLERLPRDVSAEQRAAVRSAAPDGLVVAAPDLDPDGIRTVVSAKELRLIRAKRRLFEALRPRRRD